jgi:RNA-dependent RNA polymerase
MASNLATHQQINRDPTMLPSDVQLVTAVDKHHDIYRQYRDVIVCSVKGEQSLASKLAGGGSYSHFSPR